MSGDSDSRYLRGAGFNTASGKHCCNLIDAGTIFSGLSFNTASGKHCCNIRRIGAGVGRSTVSIPQAVSTVAT